MISFKLHIEPFSINSMYYKKNFGKTKEAKIWSRNVFFNMDTPEIRALFATFREEFDPQQHGIFVELDWYLTKQKLFTKKGHLSAKSPDITNIEKPFVDLIFLPKYFKLDPPEGFPNLNVDDKYLIGQRSMKHVSPTGSPYVIVNISLIDLSQHEDQHKKHQES